MKGETKMTKEIFLPTYRLERVDGNNQSHWDYLSRLYQDNSIQEVLPDMILTLVEKKSNVHPYISYFGNNKIGFIKVWKVPFCLSKSAEIECAIEKKYRNYDFGKNLVREFTDYLLSDKAPQELQFTEIVARINPANLASIYAADQAGFELTNQYHHLEYKKKRK
mgnify:CR=1 FL=1